MCKPKGPQMQVAEGLTEKPRVVPWNIIAASVCLVSAHSSEKDGSTAGSLPREISKNYVNHSPF